MATATEPASPAARFLERPKRMLIDGEWIEARHSCTLEVYDPALGEVIDHVPSGDAEDVGLAVTAARRALEDSEWSRLTASERGRLIWRIGDLILENAEELAAIESLDNGKPLSVACAVDVPLAGDLFHVHGRLCDQDSRPDVPDLGSVCPGRAVPRLHLEGADRGGWPDHPVELPAPDGGAEARPGARDRMHGRAQAGGADTAERAAAG